MKQPKAVVGDHYLAEIRAILAQVFKDRRCEIYLFGSRAMGTHTTVSDFDIGVLASEEIGSELSLAREALDNSNIPFAIDLVDLRATSTTFSHRVQAEGILLWKN